MILKALTLENFKGTREPVRIEFAPLTLLFGPNNAGKSTVVQALMYAREILKHNNCNPRRTELGGNTVDLGGFDSLVHLQDPTRSIRMRFELEIDLTAHFDLYELEKISEFTEQGKYDDNNQKVWFRNPYGHEPVYIDPFAAPGKNRVDIWIELEIGWLEAGSHRSPGAPTVRRYCVGSGPTKCAEIAVDGDTGSAWLTFLNADLFPVVAATAHYTQGEKSNFDWDFERLTRGRLRGILGTKGWGELGMGPGITVAAPDEEPLPGESKVSRAYFDILVLDIVSGTGPWGDATVDPATGETNPRYRFRQKLLELAEAAGRWRLLGNDGLEESVIKAELDDDMELVGWARDGYGSEGDDREAIHRLLHPHALRDTEEQEHDAQFRIPYKLMLSGTAAPYWGEPLEPGYRGRVSDETLRALSPFLVRPGDFVLRVLEDSIYLGPYRRLPFREFRLNDEPPKPDWGSGLAAWFALAASCNSALVDQVNHWLSGSRTGFCTDYSITVHRFKSLPVDGKLWRDLMTGEFGAIQQSIREGLAELPEHTNKLELWNIQKGLAMAPQDLGIGISQLIPVIVAALSAKLGIVAIEEPESNIHPAFQVVLADLFISQAKANRDALFLIETHSEHLMLRCLRRIRETNAGELAVGDQSLRPEEIAVHFVEPSEGSPRFHRIRIDEDGEFLDPWPRGFFSERMTEVYGDDL